MQSKLPVKQENNKRGPISPLTPIFMGRKLRNRNGENNRSDIYKSPFDKMPFSPIQRSETAGL